MGGEPIHILHVDDEPGFATMTASFLQREDDRVVVETELNVTDALDTLATTSVDCVISDYNMAGRDGIDWTVTVGRSPTGGARFTISGVTIEDPPDTAPDTQEQVSLE